MLMLVGMGTVFVFLTLLVGTMSLMSGLVRRMTPAPAAAVPGSTDAEEMAAAAAAVELHRRRHGQKPR